MRKGRRSSFFEMKSGKNGFCRHNRRQLEFRNEIAYIPPEIGDEITCYMKEKKKWEIYSGWLWNHAETCGTLLGTKVFPGPLLPMCREGAFSLRDVSWLQKGRVKELKIRGLGECRDKGKVVKKKERAATVQVPPQEIRATIWSLSPSTGTNASTQVDDDNFKLHRSTWNLDWLELEGNVWDSPNTTRWPTSDQSEESHTPSNLLPQFCL